jgi:endopeptidase La
VAAAAHTANLTQKSSASDSKSQSAVAFEGSSPHRPSASPSDVVGAEGAKPDSLPRSAPVVPSTKSSPPLPLTPRTLGSRVWSLWPAALNVAVASAAAFLLYHFGSSAAGSLPFLFLAGTIGQGPTPGLKTAFLASIRSHTEPGKLVSYAKVAEIGLGLGLDANKAGALFTDLLQEGHIGIRENRDAVYFSFKGRASSPSMASSAEHSADVLASEAVKKLNSSSSADHAIAAAKADLAVAAYEKLGVSQIEEAKALRGNAMLEFFTGLLSAHEMQLKSMAPTPKLAARAADVAAALAWLHEATYQAGYVPPMPESVHRKLVALIGTLNPQGEDGRAAEGEVADGYIAALDLLEKFDPVNFLLDGPAKSPAPEGSWKPSDAQAGSFLRAVRARTSPGETVTRETLMRAGKSLDLDAAQINAAVSALAASGRLLVLTNGMVLYFDLYERAQEDQDGIWDVHAEVVDGLKLANAPGTASPLRAVAKLDAARRAYLKERKSDALEQVSIALGNAKLEAIGGALWAHEKALNDSLEGTRPAWGGLDLGAIAKRLAVVRLTLAMLAPVYYSAERRQDISESLAAGLDETATLEVLREAAGAELDADASYGAELTRAFVDRVASGQRAGSTPRDKGPRGPAGDLDSSEGFQERMDAIGMPAHIQGVAKKEYAKLKEMDPSDSEAQKLRTYLEWLTDLPWGVRSEDQADIAAARVILDRDHAGLELVKERVLEFLAVRKKTGSKKGAIIAFTGPPGTGKTSIASSIAAALGRKFVRLSLGGVHDESVLRGHGRTYVGSMPGEVMRQMKNAGTINPVMLMDEVDKIGRDSAHGDPTAALLEILDPEQNSTFRDRYLDVPFDLSEVLFVVTSNDLNSIPAPLRDRMEIIEFDGYTTLEKLEIAERHVVPQKRELAGLKPGEAALTNDALRAIIEGYTMEAGVRNLREKIETLFRKISAWTETRGEPSPAVIDEKDIVKYLGVERFSARAIAQNGVGVATGLAVNTFGGSTLNVEVSKEPGTGQLKLRKQFGDDIEDSAKNAYKYVKTHAAQLGLEGFDFTTIDVDINITPAGKVDGPSAGGLMVTAIVSALTGRPVKAGIAMTGEITMRGDILPIGGLKQKVMAAHRMGYTEVIFPYANLKDIENIPKEVRDGIKLTPAKTYDDIFPAAF